MHHPKRLRLFRMWRVCSLLLVVANSNCWGDALDRLSMERLKSTHAAVQEMQRDWKAVSLPSRYHDYRGVMHVHSRLSHDSRSSPEEIRKAAVAVGVKVVMFNEHPAAHYDYVRDGHRGLQEGVLFVPGAESGGLLVYPQSSVNSREIKVPQDHVDAVNRTRGMAFLCHLEERMDWDLKGLTGSEIYNVHADFKEEKRLVKSMQSPTGLLSLMMFVRNYPQETMAALQDYPADYLRRWDELCQKSRLTGVAANDAHHNQAIRGVIREQGELQIEDALGQKLAKISTDKFPLLKPLVFGKQVGEKIDLVDLDPYEKSFRHVNTHLFLSEQSEPAVREALKAGRTYVSFEWISDPTGFNFQAVHGNDVHEMGSDIPFQPGLKFRSVATQPVRFRLVRNGKEAQTHVGRAFELPVEQPGVYRIEAWVNLPDGPQIWILSSPIYIREAVSAK